jgi:hypothetical protein
MDHLTWRSTAFRIQHQGLVEKVARTQARRTVRLLLACFNLVAHPVGAMKEYARGKTLAQGLFIYRFFLS